MRAPRRLVSTRRRVPAARRAEYDALWSRLHAATTARGAHAWRFASAAEEGLFLEFLEFASDSDPRPALPLPDLEGAFPGEAEEWEES